MRFILAVRSAPLGDITQILRDWDQDKRAAIDQLTPLVYQELYRIAASYMRSVQPDHTLQPTALINEAWLRIVRHEGTNYRDRTHFFALAAKIMRAVLVDFARSRKSQKRGSGAKVQLGEISLSDTGARQFLDVHEALDRLKLIDERKASVVELRYFGGLTFDEVAETLGISAVTAKRDAAFAEAWLRRALATGPDAPAV